MSNRTHTPLTERARLTGALVVGNAALALLGGLTAPAHAAGPPTGAAPCLPGLGIGLVDVPAGADPRAQTYLVAHVRPGATLRRRFQVCNGTTTPVTVALYPAAATIGGGAFTVPPGRTGNDLTSWITVDPPTATLAVGQRLLATATLHVPAQAVTGEGYAALLAELPATRSAAGMTVVDRTGLRVYLDVGPGGDPVSDFTIDSLQATRDRSGIAHVLALVHNTGARALDLHGVLDLTGGPGSQNAGPFPARVGTTIAPHGSAPVDITLSAAIRSGPWTATLSLASGALTRQAHGALSFPDRSDSHTLAVPARPGSTGPHRGVLIGLALALLLLVLLLLLLARRSRRRRGEPPPRTPPATGLPDGVRPATG